MVACSHTTFLLNYSLQGIENAAILFYISIVANMTLGERQSGVLHEYLDTLGG